jgi:pilus assembly protein TadC
MIRVSTCLVVGNDPGFSGRFSSTAIQIEWGDDRNNALKYGREGYYGFFIKILF